MSLLLSSALAALFAIQGASAYTPEALADQVVNLPGAENLEINFNQFSGYLDIPGVKGALTKHMHYWFVESMNNPAADPIAFWTNGGPGCSGLLGFLTEQGPFHPDANNKLLLNPYAWNKISNMVFIESPASVGFSYSDDKDNDYTTGDDQTAEDNYNLIQAFMDRFPEYRKNDLYISSESYGGHYIPTLAKRIVDKNTQNKEAGNTDLILPFKGFAVGNPYTDFYSGTPAMIDTYWGHQLVAMPYYESYQKDCIQARKPNVRECATLLTNILNGVGNLNPYALDYPVCLEGERKVAGLRSDSQRFFQLRHQLKMAGVEIENLKMNSGSQTNTVDEYEPCTESYAGNYLNQVSVKKALHVAENIRWAECSYRLNYNSTDGKQSTAPIYNYLIDGGYGLDILVFSGDNDGVCGTIGTQKWIWDLGYELSNTVWAPQTVNGQTSGYLTKWKDTKLAFLTVHGAGHEVPAYKPAEAFDLWARFLSGELTN